MDSIISELKNKICSLKDSNSKIITVFKGLNFEFQHLSKICILSLIVFFVVLQATGLYTSDVEAYDISDRVRTYNSETYDVNYGHTDELAAIAKDILSDKVSVISEAKMIKKDARHCILEIDKYVAEIKLIGYKTLGEVESEVRITLKNTYYSKGKKLAELYCDDKYAEIGEGMVCIYKVKLNLKDIDAPKIALTTYDTTLSETDSFNEGSYIRSIVDNYDGNIYSYTVEGNDLGVNGDLFVGKHVLTYKVKDSSGNESSAQLIVRVKQKVKAKVYKQVADSPFAGSVVAEARKYVGCPYVWGATGPSAFDCSGLVKYVYAKAGVYVPRTSMEQAYYGQEINPNDRSQWRAGDIISFGTTEATHVAIYTGSGTMVHAINPSYGVCETSVYGQIYSVRRP